MTARVWVRMKRGKEGGEKRERGGKRKERERRKRGEKKKRRKSIEAWMLSEAVVQDASGIKTPAEGGRYRIRRKNV